MEKWDAYDHNEKKLDIVLIRGNEIPEGVYHIVCEVLVRHVDGSYLCMKRDKSKKGYPGYYETTAGGSALEGEDKYSCIRRELLEETGIICENFRKIKRTVQDEDNAIFYSFVCTVDCDKNSVRLQEGETEGYKWMDKVEFMDFINSDKVIEPQKKRFYGYFVEEGLISSSL